MEQFLSALILEIFGKFQLVFYVAYFFYVIFGIILSTAIVALKTRDKSSTRTPEKFNFFFLIKDNWLRIFTSLLVVFLTIRFGEESFDRVPTYTGAIALGFCFDLIVIQLEKIKTKTNQIFTNIFQGLNGPNN